MIRLLFLSGLLIFAIDCYPADRFRSSASPEFPNGLHVKYLNYLAVKLEMDVVITPMPFARRVKALRLGNIDLMVGLQKGHDENNEFNYVYPSYEQLKHALFVRKKEFDLIKRPADLSELSAAVTINARYYEDLYTYAAENLVKVSTLEQKIALLLKGRVDTFVHFKESARPVIEQMGLNDEIVLAEYQPDQQIEYFVAVSKNSPFFEHLSKLQQILHEGLIAGDFAKIRYEHYLSLE